MLNVMKNTTKGTSLINQAAMELFQLTDFQQKNQFEIVLLPEEFINLRGDTLKDTAKRVAKSALDLTVAQFYVQNMDIPHNAVEFTRYDNLQAVQDMTYADEVTITFIETEAGLVRQFLANWMSLQFTRDEIMGGYHFADNQWLGRKQAIIMPLSRLGLPQTAWWQIKGMRFKTHDSISFDQQAPDPMTISCTFAVDEVYINTLF